MTTKILALTDALGNLIDFRLMPGQAHDLVKTRELLAGVCCQSLLADKAFDADWLRDLLAERRVLSQSFLGLGESSWGMYRLLSDLVIWRQAMIDFKGGHYPKEVVLYAVFFYVRYGVSYRDLEEIMTERGVAADHSTIQRWVEKYSLLIAAEAQKRKAPSGSSWRMDETYVKVKGKWAYLYRAIDKDGKTLDFMLSEKRDEAAATKFFAKTVASNGWPNKVVIDKSGANTAGLWNMNALLLMNGWYWLIEIIQAKYLNNIIEQDHRFIKKLTRPMKGFKSFGSAQATLAGIETAHMIRKGQLGDRSQSAFKQFASLAG